MQDAAEHRSVRIGGGPKQPGDDYALMEAVTSERDPFALRELYDRYSGLVFTLCLRVLSDRGEAEDLLIDVFHELWNRCDRYDPTRSNPQTYLVLLARSRAIDRLRSRSGSVSATWIEPDPEQVSVTAARDPLEQAQHVEDKVRVGVALQSLDPLQRQAIECSFYEGLSHAEIAVRLGKPLGTVKTWIRLGLISLREMLRESA